MFTLSNFQNSLVTTYFSVVDYYKPKFFLFENVKNFATKNSNGFLKAVLACALKIGYQVRYAVLQSGSYGVPQSRHRFVVLVCFFPVFKYCVLGLSSWEPCLSANCLISQKSPMLSTLLHMPLPSAELS